MIIVIIDTTSDAHLLHKVYEGVEDSLVLVNPKAEELDKLLRERPNETLVGLGHGCSSGLFGASGPMIIGERNIDLLKDRELVCIWCNANGFGDRHPELQGFFTSMFISNAGEAYCYNFQGYNDDDIFAEVTLFSERVNKLLKDKTPLNEWVQILYDQHDPTKGYVVFNYQGLKYFGRVDENNKRVVIEYDYIDKQVIEEQEEVKPKTDKSRYSSYLFDDRAFDDDIDWEDFPEEGDGMKFLF